MSFILAAAASLMMCASPMEPGSGSDEDDRNPLDGMYLDERGSGVCTDTHTKEDAPCEIFIRVDDLGAFYIAIFSPDGFDLLVLMRQDTETSAQTLCWQSPKSKDQGFFP